MDTSNNVGHQTLVSTSTLNNNSVITRNFYLFANNGGGLFVNWFMIQDIAYNIFGLPRQVVIVLTTLNGLSLFLSLVALCTYLVLWMISKRSTKLTLINRTSLKLAIGMVVINMIGCIVRMVPIHDTSGGFLDSHKYYDYTSPHSHATNNTTNTLGNSGGGIIELVLNIDPNQDSLSRTTSSSAPGRNSNLSMTKMMGLCRVQAWIVQALLVAPVIGIALMAFHLHHTYLRRGGTSHWLSSLFESKRSISATTAVVESNRLIIWVYGILWLGILATITIPPVLVATKKSHCWIDQRFISDISGGDAGPAAATAGYYFHHHRAYQGEKYYGENDNNGQDVGNNNEMIVLFFASIKSAVETIFQNSLELICSQPTTTTTSHQKSPVSSIDALNYLVKIVAGKIPSFLAPPSKNLTIMAWYSTFIWMAIPIVYATIILVFTFIVVASEQRKISHDFLPNGLTNMESRNTFAISSKSLRPFCFCVRPGSIESFDSLFPNNPLPSSSFAGGYGRRVSDGIGIVGAAATNSCLGVNHKNSLNNQQRIFDMTKSTTSLQFQIRLQQLQLLNTYRLHQVIGIQLLYLIYPIVQALFFIIILTITTRSHLQTSHNQHNRGRVLSGLYITNSVIMSLCGTFHAFLVLMDPSIRKFSKQLSHAVYGSHHSSLNTNHLHPSETLASMSLHNIAANGSRLFDNTKNLSKIHNPLASPYSPQHLNYYTLSPYSTTMVTNGNSGGGGGGGGGEIPSKSFDNFSFNKNIPGGVEEEITTSEQRNNAEHRLTIPSHVLQSHNLLDQYYFHSLSFDLPYRTTLCLVNGEGNSTTTIINSPPPPPPLSALPLHPDNNHNTNSGGQHIQFRPNSQDKSYDEDNDDYYFHPHHRPSLVVNNNLIRSVGSGNNMGNPSVYNLTPLSPTTPNTAAGGGVGCGRRFTNDTIHSVQTPNTYHPHSNSNSQQRNLFGSRYSCNNKSSLSSSTTPTTNSETSPARQNSNNNIDERNNNGVVCSGNNENNGRSRSSGQNHVWVSLFLESSHLPTITISSDNLTKGFVEFFKKL